MDEYYTIEQAQDLKAMCNHCHTYIQFIPKHKNRKKMGLENNEHAVYLSIGDGKITRRVKTPTATSVTRTTKEGKTIHEEIYDAVTGHITNITVSSHETYGKFWNVHIKDGEDKYILQMNYSSGYASSFLKQLPNVNFNFNVRFSPNVKMNGDKKQVTLFLSQRGIPLKHAFTKDNPGDLPPMVQVRVKGVMQWDDTDMMEFFEKMVKEEILPKLNQPVSGGKEEIPEIETEEANTNPDDLPF